MMDLMLAEFGIRQTQARYADAVWRKDRACFVDCFAEDGVWNIAGMTLRGRTEIGDAFDAFMVNFHGILMTFRTPIVDITNGEITARTYCTEQNNFLNGRDGCTMGTYFERFVKQGDRLRYTWRMFQLHYLGPADIRTPFLKQTDYGAPPNMPPLDATVPNYSNVPNAVREKMQ